jgi:membrane-associated phospholipid phosphatase
MDTAILTWVHGLSSPGLDAAFALSWVLGAFRFCAPAVLLAIVWHRARGEPREALAWLAVGLLVAAVPEILKAVVARPRPALWPWLLPTNGSSFPSGHAVAGMAFYPLLGWILLRSRGLPWMGYALGAAIGVFIGVGRLYVGVHWPSDVAAGWALGAALSIGAVRWLSLAEPALTARLGSSRVDRLEGR